MTRKGQLTESVAIGVAACLAAALAASAQEEKTVWAQEYAFAWADQPAAPLATPYTPDPAFSYSHLGGSVQVVRQGVGVYDVTFGSFGAV
jgi:hypothetical protein